MTTNPERDDAPAWRARSVVNGDLAIYVPNPAPPSRHRLAVSHIAPRSGIVGATEPEPTTGLIVIDYEGALYQPSNIRTWADKVLHAEDRHRQQYPTVARCAAPPEALLRVGTLSAPAPDRITPRLWVTDRRALAVYLGFPVIAVDSDAFITQLQRTRR
jgi:hypothetical protein